ncbi:hypothetical protein CK203_008347 [Vitis vinifera]|uniref:Reverse transcriptase RNase H-like domain-containing protein n=1 Tax=Vitis vinifera TaxID=29760 RepID=A0A438KNG7_VITVI|nr:hypothetical protein CK203_008347 [Vitis vinifera]
MVATCPYHRFDNWMLVLYFYEGMSPPMKQLLETMCRGGFMNKNPNEAFQFPDYVAEVSRSWEEPIVKEPPRDRIVNRQELVECIPYLRRHKVGDKTLEILEVLMQVKINIPLLDMIKQVSAYAKFLKDLCIVKRRIKLSKKAFLTKQFNAIIENKAMVKYKDPVEMNVFNLCKQLIDHDDVEDEEACLIKALVQEHTKKLMEENIDGFFSTIAKEERIEVATKWKEKCTIQSLNSVENDKESKKGEVEISKPELKPLLHGLKYIYPISDSSWVSPTQVVPNKHEIIVVKNDQGELILTRLTTSWQVCIDFRKLNPVTKKDHFPLPFLDQVLERVAAMTIISSWMAFRCIEKDLVQIGRSALQGNLNVGAILGQREDGKPYVVYYASKTLNDAQKNYITTEKSSL